MSNEVKQLQAQSQQAQKIAKENLDFLAALALPLVYTSKFPPLYKAVWAWLLSSANLHRKFPQLALGLPRGFCKTTLMKLFVAYCILYTEKRFILIVNATATLAENTLSDISDILSESNITSLYGNWELGQEKDTQSLKKFGYRGRDIIIGAIGAGTGIRGLNIKNIRPDVIIFDDIQNRECADSEKQSAALLTWMFGTAMKAKSPFGCMFLFVANMYPTPYSILKKLKYNPNWIKFIVGGILTDGSSLWEEIQPIKQLIAEYENDKSAGHPEIFYAEVLNDEHAAVNNLIDFGTLPTLPYIDGDVHSGNFIIIDPATDKSNSDLVSIGYFEVHDTKPVLMHLKEGRFSPSDTIRESLQFALNNNCKLIAVEATAYQYSLLHWFEQVCAQKKITGITIIPIYPGIRSKNARILSMFKAYMSGDVFVHDRVKAIVHAQMSGFNPLKRNNTDGILDLLAYADKVLADAIYDITASTIIEQQEFDAIALLENTAPF